MSDVLAEEIPPLLLHSVPESAEFIAEKYQMPAESAVLTQDAVLDLYEVLAECFTTPVLMPQLERPTPDSELLGRCWGFVERIVDHPSQHVRGAVYFEVLEQLLNAGRLVEAAWPHMKQRTRARTVTMLDTYGVVLSDINRR
ncbi:MULTISPECIES: hypothetical protein [Streptomyces]|uniref:hypothetical protein n=1 Tax=Streptomyces TaxID=1883 RepID=UPI00056B08E8|nr:MULTISPECIES: hypothetical protein [Streptomyces]MBZ6114204.1 hypothetical protein [Streptomyces olivaceus]MBZ6128309.1 hypothetical protein [Streptomyces olivaceus]MBZ6148848.1 hypothetical protein [Streptomyces olivaceus]MBZ6163073.1 hypothetical protein [Streptomyces olivaceus]MBZ6190877.1 hypothetical protein [Streptomyces olivaceus]